MDVRETEIASLEAIGQTLVIDAQHVQDRRLQVEHRYRIGHHVVAEVVGLPENGSGLHAAAGHPHAEVAWMMVAPVIDLRQLPLAEHGPAELAAPDHERVVE